MKPAGQAEVERAKADGRWDRAYSRQSEAEPAPDLEAALDAPLGARSCSMDWTLAFRFAVRLSPSTSGPPEAGFLSAALVEMLARGETIHPRRKTKGVR